MGLHRDRDLCAKRPLRQRGSALCREVTCLFIKRVSCLHPMLPRQSSPTLEGIDLAVCVMPRRGSTWSISLRRPKGGH